MDYVKKPQIENDNLWSAMADYDDPQKFVKCQTNSKSNSNSIIIILY